MHPYSSRILRLGLINSGMFDLLDLNLDVQAIHLIAANNVGKTSLIELIQFLYFDDLRQMTFSKPLAESLPFYFRPEGSYILFQVRTVQQTIRTIGIYGEGTAPSREIFVFDGPFQTADFLDETQKVLPLRTAQAALLSRGYSRFQRFEDYERALIGQHNDGRYNVPLFDLTPKNFRLLRRLLQGLLRLDKLTSAEVRNFLIQIVESQGNVRTKIDISQTFEQRYREIQTIERQLTDLRLLEPVIREWQQARQQIADIEEKMAANREKLFHTAGRYLALLKEQLTEAEQHYQAIQQEKSRLAQERDKAVETQAHYRIQIREQENIIQEWERLAKACQPYNRPHVAADLERLRREHLILQEQLKASQSEPIQNLRQRCQRLQNDETDLRRRLEQHTVEQLLMASDLAEEPRILLRYLLSERLISLPAALVPQPDDFLAAAHQAAAYLDDEGVFRGFGLAIPRTTWYRPERENEPLTSRLAQVQQQLADTRQQLQVAEDRQRAEAKLRQLEQQIRQQEQLISHFDDLDQLQLEQGSLDACRGRCQQWQTQLEQAQAEQMQLKAATAEQERKSEQFYARLAEIRRLVQDVQSAYHRLQPFDTPMPADVADLPFDVLAEEYRLLSQDRLIRQERELRHWQTQLEEPQLELERRYDRATPDLPFDAWVTQRLDITQEITRIEEQLNHNYHNLITQVRAELSNLTNAYTAVQNQVAELNGLIRRVTVSNIQRIQLETEESELVEAIRQTSAASQLGLFGPQPHLTFEQGEQFVNEYLSRLRGYRELDLADMFQLAFQITFEHDAKPVKTGEINQFESNGTRIAVKIVLYLGLIKLLQKRKNQIEARLPFFLDEVGSIDSKNLRQLIDYCQANNFLPIFASPDIRPDIPHNYIFKRNGARSYLESEVILTATDRESE